MSVPSARVRPMRLLHTSDWHLGRSLHRADLLAAQSVFLDHLVDTVRAEKVDAVLVAGDIYDRAVPPVDAVEMCEDALNRLHDAGSRIVLISGNHDSARRLGFGSDLLDKTGGHLRPRPRGHAGVLGHAVRCIRADARRSGIQRRVVMAHGWVAGGAASESERDITVGGIGQVPADLFGGFSYVALGHLHGP